MRLAIMKRATWVGRRGYPLAGRCPTRTRRIQHHNAPGHYIRLLNRARPHFYFWPPRHPSNENPPRYLSERSASSATHEPSCRCQFKIPTSPHASKLHYALLLHFSLHVRKPICLLSFLYSLLHHTQNSHSCRVFLLSVSAFSLIWMLLFC